ncbi:MAG: hypothetical protein GY737_12450 [Desulfobacteraceae bacterium]|nr:hypothetical protein [Desulfobacteraceae bacterium]
MVYEIGQQIEKNNLVIHRLKKLVKVVNSHSDFSLIGFREINHHDNREGKGEAVIVECLNHEVSTEPAVDIKYKERLAITCWDNDDFPPRVQALRKSFPKTIHRYHTLKNHPRELCLYEQPWSDVRITWTPQLFLNRILWWLKAAAEKKLHQPDQPLEQVFFHIGVSIIVPNNLNLNDGETWFIGNCSQDQTTMLRMTRAERSRLEDYRRGFSRGLKGYHPIFIEAKPKIHGEINVAPGTLGELHNHLQGLGINLWEIVKKEVQRLFRDNGNLDPVHELLLIFITFPGKRDKDSDLEIAGRQYAFLVRRGMGEIGLKNDILVNNKFSGGDGKGLETIELCLSQKNDWQKEQIMMANIIPEVTLEDLRNFNRIKRLPGINPLLIGCGSLGSHLFNQWLRMGWSNWVIVDNDDMLPHNIARHILKNTDVGYKKTDSIQLFSTTILPEGNQNDVTALSLDATADHEELEAAFNKADFIIDVSTTLAVPRMLSQKEIARCVSLFITPSGHDCVLLLEDSNRDLKLHQIEAQYYNWIINHGAGEIHLTGHTGSIRYGGGCRDISAQIPLSYLTLHAGILCQQLISKGNRKEAFARAWQFNDDTGSVTSNDIELYPSHEQKIKNWNVIWDDGVIKKANEYRKHKLPDETGGIIVGYIDQSSKSIFIVDIRKAPENSASTSGSFQRELQGVSDDVGMIKNRTAHIVNYIGEWHSHPDTIPAEPSREDYRQLEWVQNEMDSYGQPGIILIIGDNNFNFFVKGDI